MDDFLKARFSRLPRHVGFIPDGNRRWAQARGLTKADGYAAGVVPGVRLIEACQKLGISEVSIYGFTQENTRRPKAQTEAYSLACVEFARAALDLGASFLALGDTKSVLFPDELRPYATRSAGSDFRVNLLVNYGWNWDLQTAFQSVQSPGNSRRSMEKLLASADVSRIDLVVRWGGRCRLSGFLPVQSVYADFFVVDEYWPDYQAAHFERALRWYETQDVTLGG